MNQANLTTLVPDPDNPQSADDPITRLDAHFSAKEQALEELLSTVALFYLRMKAVAELLHGEGEFSGGKRSILRQLVRSGPMTVPQLARIRPVSRQFIQRLADEMAAAGMVEFVANPAHRRSKLLQITPLGKLRFVEMMTREAAAGKQIAQGLSEEEIATALRVLQHLRTELIRWHEQYPGENKHDDP